MTKGRTIKLGVLFSFLLLFSACTATSIQKLELYGERPGEFSKLIVIARNCSEQFAVKLEKSLVIKLHDEGIEAVSFQDNISSGYNLINIESELIESGIDGILQIDFTRDFSKEKVVSQHQNFYSLSSSRSVPLRRSTREVSAMLSLFDIKSRERIWTADMTTSGRWSLMSSDGSYIRSMTGRIVEVLIKNGLN
jgi:hypothetical protein